MSNKELWPGNNKAIAEYLSKKSPYRTWCEYCYQSFSTHKERIKHQMENHDAFKDLVLTKQEPK